MNRPAPAILLAVLAACALGCGSADPSADDDDAPCLGTPSLPCGLLPRCLPGACEPPYPAMAGADDDRFVVAGWVPYWRKAEGVASLPEDLGAFTEINPFAWVVNDRGGLADAARFGSAPWAGLRETARRKNVRIVPTILWTDAAAMRRVFSDRDLLDAHVGAIADLLAREGFPGVDVDYEGKDVADRDAFSAFLRTLHARLSADGRSLSCTVEARTSDSPPPGFPAAGTMAWANDFTVLRDCCDTVRLMAYDEAFLSHGTQDFVEDGRAPSLAVASLPWVEETIRYALRFLPGDRLVLGIPTYGWEFDVAAVPGGWRYRMVQSVGWLDTQARMQRKGAVAHRNAGGETTFAFKTRKGRSLLTVADARSVADRIALAKRFGLRGIALFKIDGLADPRLMETLEAAAR